MTVGATTSFLILDKDLLTIMTSSNGNIFHITGPLCEEFTGEFPSQKPVERGFRVFFDLCLNKQLSNLNNRGAGDLRRHLTHYDVTVIISYDNHLK